MWKSCARSRCDRRRKGRPLGARPRLFAQPILRAAGDGLLEGVRKARCCRIGFGPDDRPKDLGRPRRQRRKRFRHPPVRTPPFPDPRLAETSKLRLKGMAIGFTTGSKSGEVRLEGTEPLFQLGTRQRGMHLRDCRRRPVEANRRAATGAVVGDAYVLKRRVQMRPAARLLGRGDDARPGRRLAGIRSCFLPSASYQPLR